MVVSRGSREQEDGIQRPTAMYNVANQSHVMLPDLPFEDHCREDYFYAVKTFDGTLHRMSLSERMKWECYTKQQIWQHVVEEHT